jgi:hypothetical protein
MNKYVLFISAILLAFGIVFSQEDYSQWAKSKKIFINTSATGYNTTTDLAGFPLLVRISKKDFNFSEANAQGNDIRFANAKGQHLSYQIERWNVTDTTKQRAAMWVNVDTIKASADSQYITLYWGKSDAPAASNGPAVFDTAQGFGGVWHLSNDLTDATVKANACTAVGGTVDTALDMFKSWYLNGTSDYLWFNPCWSTSPQGVTVSGWIRPDALSGTIIYLGSKGETNFFLGSNLEYYNKFADSTWLGTNAGQSYGLAAGSWSYVTGVWSYGQYIRAFINGNQSSSRDSVSQNLLYDPGSTFKCEIGAMNSGSPFFGGAVYEMRVMTKSASPDWIKLCYLTQKISAEAPPTIKYPTRNIQITITGDTMQPIAPVTTEMVDSFSISAGLPAYIFFSSSTGILSGLPMDTCVDSTIYIRAYNAMGYSEDTITLTVSHPPVSVKKRLGKIWTLGLLGISRSETPRIFFSMPSAGGIRDLSFCLYDCKGATVWSSRLNASGLQSGVQSIAINFTGRTTVNSGVYFLKMTSTDVSGRRSQTGTARFTMLR